MIKDMSFPVNRLICLICLLWFCRACITLNAQFRQSCNAFFIDLVTTVCFKDNIPPSKGVILHLLSFLMVETEPIPLIRGTLNTHTHTLAKIIEFRFHLFLYSF